MSERGSWVTQYIYCHKCFEAVKAALCQDDKFWRGQVIKMWGGRDGDIHIAAGKVGALSYGGEVGTANEIIEETGIASKLCHDVRLTVMCDSGWDTVITIKAGKAGKV